MRLWRKPETARLTAPKRRDDESGVSLETKLDTIEYELSRLVRDMQAVGLARSRKQRES